MGKDRKEREKEEERERAQGCIPRGREAGEREIGGVFLKKKVLPEDTGWLQGVGSEY